MIQRCNNVRWWLGAMVFALAAPGCGDCGGSRRHLPAASSGSARATAASATVTNAAVGEPWRPGETCSALRLRKRDEEEKGPLRHVVWSPDQRQFVTSSTTSGGHGTFRHWDSATLTVMRTKHTDGEYHGVGYVRESRASYHAKGNVALVEAPPSREPWIWHLGTDKLVPLKAKAALPATLVSPDGGRALVVSPYGFQQLFDTQTGTAGESIDPGKGSSSMGVVEVWVPGGRKLITSDGLSSVYLWELDAMKVSTLTRDPFPKAFIGLAELKLAPDRDTLWMVHGSKTVELWSIAKQKRLRTLQRGTWVANLDSGPSHSLAFSRDGAWAVVVFADQTGRMWSLPDGTKSFDFATKPVSSDMIPRSAHAEFSPDGAYFAMHTDAVEHDVTLYAFGTPPREVMRMKSGWTADGWVGFSGWSETGHTFLRGQPGKTREVWDPATQTRVGPAPPETKAQGGLELSANGDLVVKRMKDGAQLTFRELESGGFVVVDNHGCVGGAVGEGRMELRDAEGATPSNDALSLARRTPMRF